MGKWRLCIVVLVLFVLGACGNVGELEAVIENQDEEIFAQNELIAILEQELEAQVQLNFDFEIEIEDLQAEIENFPQENQSNISGEQHLQQQNMLAHDLMENIEELTIEYLGAGRRVESSDDILFPSHDLMWTRRYHGYVIARVATSYVILSYEIDAEDPFTFRSPVDWEAVDVSINWEVIAYVLQGGLRVVGERTPRHLTDLETVTIRIYEFDINVHPYDAWSYHEETILGDQLWEETLRLIPEVWDLWYEGSTLYVDLMPSYWLIGGSINVLAMRMQRNFLSFPHISEIRFLVGGYPRMPDTGHTDPYERSSVPHIINAEDGMPMPICDLPIDDPGIDEQWWRRECE